MPDPTPVPVRWWQDPAFRAWYETSVVTLGTALGVGQATTLMPTWTAIEAWGAATFIGALLMIRHVFLRGPDLLQAPPVDAMQAKIDAAVKAALAAQPKPDVPMPSFERGDGPTTERLGTIEDYLARKDEYDRARAEEVARVMADLDHRISKLEAWKVEVLVFIGATKIRWGVVSFVTAALSAIMVAGAIKVLGL